MNCLPKRIRAGLALAMGLAGVSVARAELSASANYRLQRNAFTMGIPDAATPPASANYRLAEGNLGDVSAPAVASANYVQHPGYLVPLDSVFSRPDLLSIAVQGGRVWLEWTAVPNAAYYAVESAIGTNKYMPVESVDTNRWDVPLVLTSRFYRIRAVLN